MLPLNDLSFAIMELYPHSVGVLMEKLPPGRDISDIMDHGLIIIIKYGSDIMVSSCFANMLSIGPLFSKSVSTFGRFVLHISLVELQNCITISDPHFPPRKKKT